MKSTNIASIPLFESLPAEELEVIYGISQARQFSAGTVLFHEGDPSNYFLVILDGELEIIKNFGTEEELRLGVLASGEYLGEMSLFLRDQQRSASVRALTDTQVVEIPRKDFEALLQRQPELAFHMMQEMSLRMRNQDRLTVQDLHAKNQKLETAYNELKAAQEQLIAQEKLKHELAVARTIQESMLPKEIPQLEGWRLNAHWEPARAVSGDFYDFLKLPGNRLGIVVGDVTDKGVPASLVMAVTRSVLRAVANSAIEVDGATSPARMLAQMNSVLEPDMPMSMFVTCLFGIIDLDKGILRYATAGHPPPIQISQGLSRELPGKGMPLGLMPDREYNDFDVEVQMGDSLLFFSDGLIEAHNDDGEMFDELSLCRVLDAWEGDELVAYMLNALEDFTKMREEPEDDVTLVSLERLDDLSSAP
jgi:sigma-B regulation protein RsbU (phosphoserine phosphatase)